MKRTMVTAAVLAASLITVGCSPSDEPVTATATPTTTSPSEGPVGTDHGHTEDPSAHAKEELALEAATIMSTWTPAQDFNRTSSEERAQTLMTEERAALVEAPQRPASGSEWRRAAEMDATSQPIVAINEDTHSHAEGTTIAVDARWQWIGASGETFAGEERRVYYFTFTDREPFKIRDYTYETR